MLHPQHMWKQEQQSRVHSRAESHRGQHTKPKPPDEEAHREDEDCDRPVKGVIKASDNEHQRLGLLCTLS